jgi:hypothetical protein
VVAKVPADLAGDRRYRERQEARATGRFKAVHRIDQANGGDLDQVFQRLTAAGKAAGYVFGDWEVAIDELIAPPPPFGIVGGELGIPAL